MRHILTIITLCSAAALSSSAMASPPAPVSVHLESRVVADLEHRASSDAPWENICVTPCDIVTMTAGEYRIVGVGVAASLPFVFDAAKGGALSVTVRTGSLAIARRGLWLLAGAGAIGIAGAITLAVGGASGAFDAGGVGIQSRTDFLFAGSLMVVAALGMGVWGTADWTENRLSRLDGPVLPAPSVGPQPEPRLHAPPQSVALSLPLISIAF
jgi:hypothetical protein